MKAFDYLIIGVFAVIVLYYLSTTLQDIQSPQYTDTWTMIANKTNVTTHSVDSTYGVELKNATFTCLSGNYTSNATHVTLLDDVCEGGEYDFVYHYQVSDTVFDLDLGFVALLVFIGAGIAITMKLTSSKK